MFVQISNRVILYVCGGMGAMTGGNLSFAQFGVKPTLIASAIAWVVYLLIILAPTPQGNRAHAVHHFLSWIGIMIACGTLSMGIAGFFNFFTGTFTAILALIVVQQMIPSKC